MMGRDVYHELVKTYADTGEPTGVTGRKSRWTVIEKGMSDGVTPGRSGS
ncbi:MAG: hypothetical protein CM15mP106_1210 [Candidatus Neomarinimicrobiota bacterium]|nr:MAG: hypothetical protein CM15mP106_1210 [Candidatus Neomarinimicrobiota bacterium]